MVVVGAMDGVDELRTRLPPGASATEAKIPFSAERLTKRSRYPVPKSASTRSTSASTAAALNRVCASSLRGDQSRVGGLWSGGGGDAPELAGDVGLAARDPAGLDGAAEGGVGAVPGALGGGRVSVWRGGVMVERADGIEVAVPSLHPAISTQLKHDNVGGRT